MKKVIIFDFDGVIVDSKHLSYSINKEMVPDLEYSEWESWFEGNLYKKIRTEHQNDKSQDLFFEKYNVGVVNLLPIEGIPEVIKALADEYTLVIISSSSQKAIGDFLNKHDLYHYFSDILARETHRNKVDKFHIILAKYKIKSDETLIITDTVGDIKEANEVGIKSVGVIWGVHSGDKLGKTNPHFIAENPSDLIRGVEIVMGIKQ